MSHRARSMRPRWAAESSVSRCRRDGRRTAHVPDDTQGGFHGRDLPVLVGVALGLATHTMRPMWLKAIVVGILGVAFGAMASWISGELATSRLYLLVDTAQVIVGPAVCGAGGLRHGNGRAGKGARGRGGC